MFNPADIGCRNAHTFGYFLLLQTTAPLGLINCKLHRIPHAKRTFLILETGNSAQSFKTLTPFLEITRKRLGLTFAKTIIRIPVGIVRLHVLLVTTQDFLHRIRNLYDFHLHDSD